MRPLIACAVLVFAAACAPRAVTPPPPSDIPARSTGAPSASPRAVDGVIYWAVDRGPVGSPVDQRLVYAFGVGDLRGPVKLLAPDGSVVGEAAVMGSGIFDASSCLSRVGSKQRGVVVIGPVIMTAAAQTAFLADPAAYRADVDAGFMKPGAGHVVLRLEDTGCRPL
ncbi:MAG TPA: hypothetical protein VGT60_12450 [Candidatus Limnocylindria bacterium]|nr:hypothetical protein [Candidatus Limnocylindria bacterium]